MISSKLRLVCAAAAREQEGSCCLNPRYVGNAFSSLLFGDFPARQDLCTSCPTCKPNRCVSGLALVLVLGTVVYAWLESMFYVDALYFTVVTATTVGFGDCKSTVAAVCCSFSPSCVPSCAHSPLSRDSCSHYVVDPRWCDLCGTRHTNHFSRESVHPYLRTFVSGDGRGCHSAGGNRSAEESRARPRGSRLVTIRQEHHGVRFPSTHCCVRFKSQLLS